MCLCIHELLGRLEESVIVRVASDEHQNCVQQNFLNRYMRLYIYIQGALYVYTYGSIYIYNSVASINPRGNPRGPSFGSKHGPFGWSWCAVGLCSPSL